MASHPQNASNGTTSGTAAPTNALLPVLPDPSSLWSSPNPSALFLLQEAQAHISQLRTLKDHCQNGRIGYAIAPPAVGSLPPLPSVPVPHTNTGRPLSVPDRRNRGPEMKPSIPSTSKLHTKTGLTECLQAFEEENGGWSANVGYEGEAVCLRGKGMTVWALVDRSSSEVRVDRIRVFTSGGTGKGKGKEVPDLSSPGWHVMLSDHLTSLNLTLPKLLYRLSFLPDILRQPCYRCSKYLKVPDGMPYGQTGYLASPTKPTSKEGDDNGNVQGRTEAEADIEKGHWVCWHESCSKAS